MKDDRELFRGRLNSSGVYDINIKIKLAEHVAMLSTTREDWHERLAHVSPNLIQFMADNKVIEGIHISAKPSPKCEPCVSSKIKRASHPCSSKPVNPKPDQILHGWSNSRTKHEWKRLLCSM